MNWNHLKVFCAVARKESLTAAAAELRVSASTASRKISELENSLGAALFHKRTTGYHLTSFGEKILPVALETEGQMNFIRRQATNQQDEKKGLVRIDLPELLGVYVIIPALRKFQKNNPHVEFEFLNSVRNIKLSNNASDVILRLSVPTSGQYKVRKIGHVAQAGYCSLHFLEQNRTKLDQKKYGEIPFIGWIEAFQEMPLAKWLDHATNGAHLWMRMSSLNSQLVAVREGLGIGCLPKFIADQNGLIHILNDTPPLNSELWLMRNSETEDQPHVDAVMECIESALHDNRSRLAWD